MRLIKKLMPIRHVELYFLMDRYTNNTFNNPFFIECSSVRRFSRTERRSEENHTKKISEMHQISGKKNENWELHQRTPKTYFNRIIAKKKHSN